MHTTRPRAGPLTCREVVELLTDHLEDALPPDERAHFEAHLDACPGCRAYVDQVVVTVRVLRMVRSSGP